MRTTNKQAERTTRRTTAPMPKQTDVGKKVNPKLRARKGVHSFLTFLAFLAALPRAKSANDGRNETTATPGAGGFLTVGENAHGASWTNDEPKTNERTLGGSDGFRRFDKANGWNWMSFKYYVIVF